MIGFHATSYNLPILPFHFQTLTVAEDPFVPTNDDLAGFWDMVYMQVVHINALFTELTKMRENGWKKIDGVRNTAG